MVDQIDAVLAWSLTCHRCFGYGFCHDPDHEDFAEGVREATCSGNRLAFSAK